jgi:hypothetical protein
MAKNNSEVAELTRPNKRQIATATMELAAHEWANYDELFRVKLVHDYCDYYKADRSRLPEQTQDLLAFPQPFVAEMAAIELALRANEQLRERIWDVASTAINNLSNAEYQAIVGGLKAPSVRTMRN